MEELPIEFCEICHNKLSVNIEEQTINVSECSKCHNLACSTCIDFRYDLNKWLCKNCYELLKNTSTDSKKLIKRQKK